MKQKQFKDAKGIYTVIREFDSIDEFYNWITTQPVNKHFGASESYQKSNKIDSWRTTWSKTRSFAEAVKLMKNGWDEAAKEIKQKLDSSKIKPLTRVQNKSTYSMAGYQACVPRYLQGIPDSMISKKQVVVKQKVVTLTKSVTYAAYTSPETMIDEGVKAIQIINRIESQGVRCNLNIILGVDNDNHRELCKIRIKSANERLNISKLAFPLAHPSMLRRLLFKYIEVSDTVTKGYLGGYGRCVFDNVMDKICKDNDEYLIPALFTKNIEEITSVEDL